MRGNSEKHKRIIPNKSSKVSLRFRLDKCLENDEEKNHNSYIEKTISPKFRKMLKTADERLTARKKKAETQRNNRANQYDFKSVVDDIQGRGATFVKMGFTSEEKKGNKKLFGQVFNLRQRDMKGTLNISDLWSNKERINFLKENKIRMNKMKFIEKLSNLQKKQIQPVKSLNSEGSLRSFQDIKLFDSSDLIDSTKSLFSFSKSRDWLSKGDIAFHINRIRSDLIKLHRDSTIKQLSGKVKTLEDCSNDMAALEKKYFVKLIDML